MPSTAEEYLIKITQQSIGASATHASLLKTEALLRKTTAEAGVMGSALAKLRGAGGPSVAPTPALSGLQRPKASLPIEASGAPVAAKAISGVNESVVNLIGKKRAIKEVLGGELGNLASAASGAGGPLGALSDKVQSLSAIAGKGGAAGVIIALAMAVYGLAKAAVEAVVNMAKFVAFTADAARSARILNEAAAGSAKGGAELSAVIADVAGKVPLARSEIAEMGRSLEIAHLSGRRMQNALETMGIVASAVGPQAASKIEEIAARAQRFRRFWVGLFELEGTGLVLADVAKALAAQLGVAESTARTMILRGQVSVDKGLEAMAKAAQDKFGKTVAAQMLSLDTQIKKLKENFSALFGGVNLEPLLAGLKMITSLFDQNTVTGRTLKLMIESLFSPLMKQASSVFPLIRAFLQGIIIGMLLIEIVVLKVRKAILEAFGGGGSKIDWVRVVLVATISAVVLATMAATALAAVFVVLGVSAFVALFPTIALFGALVVAIYFVVKAVRAVKDRLASVDLGGAAANMVGSFIAGITSRIGSVVSAMMDLGGAAAQALKSALGIASPSKVALDAAQNVTTTFAGKIEDGSGDAQADMASMVNPGALAAAGGGGRGAPKVGELHFHYHGGGGADEFEAFKAHARAWWREELEMQLGEGAPA